jgi:hypothetical protein
MQILDADDSGHSVFMFHLSSRLVFEPLHLETSVIKTCNTSMFEKKYVSVEIKPLINTCLRTKHYLINDDQIKINNVILINDYEFLVLILKISSIKLKTRVSNLSITLLLSQLIPLFFALLSDQNDMIALFSGE